MLMQKFGVVQAPRTSSNLLEPQQHRVSKVWRGLSQAFGVGRLYRTFSIYSVTGETRSAGCLSTSSGWFKHFEPQRTYTNHNITERTRCGEVCHLRSGWFDCTEPSLSTALQGKQGVQGASVLVRGGSSSPNLFEPSLATSLQGQQGEQGAYALVRGGSSLSNLIEPTRHHHRASKVCSCISHEFGVVRLYRTFSSYKDGVGGGRLR